MTTQQNAKSETDYKYLVRIYDAGKVVSAKQFATYFEAMQWAGTQERLGIGVSVITPAVT